MLRYVPVNQSVGDCAPAPLLVSLSDMGFAKSIALGPLPLFLAPFGQRGRNGAVRSLAPRALTMLSMLFLAAGRRLQARSCSPRNDPKRRAKASEDYFFHNSGTMNFQVLAVRRSL